METKEKTKSQVLKCIVITVIVLAVILIASIFVFNYSIQRNVEIETLERIIQNIDHPESFSVLSINRYKDTNYTFYVVIHTAKYNDILVESGLRGEDEYYHRMDVYRYNNGTRSRYIAIYDLDKEKWLSDPLNIKESYLKCVESDSSKYEYSNKEINRFLEKAKKDK